MNYELFEDCFYASTTSERDREEEKQTDQVVVYHDCLINYSKLVII